MAASVKVAVRVRPMNQREINLGAECIIQMEGQSTKIINTKMPHSGSEGDMGRDKTKSFSYDYSYWSCQKADPNFSSQNQVFQDLGSEVLKNAFEGYNACVFAYGQTGSGKSYTMMGNQPDVSDSHGLIPRICEGLFQHIESDGSDTSYRTEVSYLEIYMEKVRDLLKSSKSDYNTHTLRLREHPVEGPYVQGLSKHLVADYGDIESLMERGNNHRTTASTNMNDVSSRSHAIFTITFTQAKFSQNLPQETISKINLVDLAGSERADATGATGQRLKEGANINKSLVTLGNVISTLAEISSQPSGNTHRRKSHFVPYRDSVLTWLLKDSLGGNSKTIMIATISPADVNYGETLSTLRYANRAKNIINKPTINEDPNVRLIRELRAEIEKLRSMITGDLRHLNAPRKEDEMVEKLHENEARVKVLTEEWEEKWRETKKILTEQTLALRREGVGIVLDSELPHLVGINDDLLSTGLRLYYLKEGQTTVGLEVEETDQKPDISLCGANVEMEHCTFDNTNGVVQLCPTQGAACAINGTHVAQPTVLSQGCLILLGSTNLFRFNHPAEAAKLRDERKSKSVGDLSTLYQSSEDLLLYTPGVEIKKRQKIEMELLEKKRREVEELENKHRHAEEERLAEEEARQDDIRKQKELLEKLKPESETAKQEAQQTRQRIEREEQQLRRQSLDARRDEELWRRQSLDVIKPEEEMCSKQSDDILEAKERDKEHPSGDDRCPKHITLGPPDKQSEESLISQAIPVTATNSNPAIFQSGDPIQSEVLDNRHKFKQAVEELEELEGEQIQLLNQEATDIAKRADNQMKEIKVRRAHLKEDRQSLEEREKKHQQASELAVYESDGELEEAVQVIERERWRIAAEEEKLNGEEAEIGEAVVRGEQDLRRRKVSLEAEFEATKQQLRQMEEEHQAEEGHQRMNDSVDDMEPNVIDKTSAELHQADSIADGASESTTDVESSQMAVRRKADQDLVVKHAAERKNLDEKFEKLREIEEEMKKAETDLQRKREEFDRESKLELERILAEKQNLREMEDKERLDELIEEEVKKRMFEEKVQREKQLLALREREKLEMEKEIQQLRKSHVREMELLKKKFAAKSRKSAVTQSNPYASLNRDGIPGSQRIGQRLSEYQQAPLDVEITEPINISIPSYILRGHGFDAHHLFEIHVQMGEESWTIYRRYSKFRELHEQMKAKYSEVAFLDFPSRRFFGSKSEKFVMKRRIDLENYLRNFLKVCQKVPSCPLSPGEGRVLTKRTLLDFTPFFKTGAFETTKFTTF